MSIFKSAERSKVDFRLLTPLAIANVLNPLNTTMLTTALIAICGAFHQTVGQGALLIVPLYLTSAIGQPLMGRLSDVFSPKAVNRMGLIIIFISAIIGVLAPTFDWLIVSRVLLGLGSSAAYPSSMTIIRKRYADEGMEVPGIVLGVLAVASQVSIAVGPFLGGILTETFGWQGIFYVNIPLVILALSLSKAIPSTPVKQSFNKELFLEKLDIIGVALFTLFLVMLMTSLIKDHFSLVSILVCIAAGVALVFWELKQSNPFIYVKLLVAKLTLSATFLRQCLTNYVVYLEIYGFPQWLEQTKKISPSHVGYIMLPLSVTSMIVGLAVSKSSNYISMLIYGTASVCLACGGLFLLNTDTAMWVILLTSALFGFALGANTIANQATLYKEAPEGQTGVTFGLFRTIGYVGAILSGTQIKHVFSKGATDETFHSLAYHALISCGLMVLLLIPLIREYFQSKNKTITI